MGARELDGTLRKKYLSRKCFVGANETLAAFRSGVNELYEYEARRTSDRDTRLASWMSSFHGK